MTQSLGQPCEVYLQAEQVLLEQDAEALGPVRVAELAAEQPEEGVADERWALPAAREQEAADHGVHGALELQALHEL